MYLKKHAKVSRYDSENLFFSLLIDTLKEGGYDSYGVLIEYPLNRLVPPSLSLPKELREYASRSWSHIDFLIYKKTTKRPILAIEVDGHRYHRASYSRAASVQQKRDTLKDNLLCLIGLPLIRLSTTGSNEKSRILDALSANR